MDKCELYLSDPSDYTRMYALCIAGVFVDIYAHDDAECYEFRIDGAVCAYLAYDAIRVDASDADFHEARLELFLSRALDARQRHQLTRGPIFV